MQITHRSDSHQLLVKLTARELVASCSVPIEASVEAATCEMASLTGRRMRVARTRERPAEGYTTRTLASERSLEIVNVGAAPGIPPTAVPDLKIGEAMTPKTGASATRASSRVQG